MTTLSKANYKLNVDTLNFTTVSIMTQILFGKPIVSARVIPRLYTEGGVKVITGLDLDLRLMDTFFELGEKDFGMIQANVEDGVATYRITRNGITIMEINEFDYEVIRPFVAYTFNDVVLRYIDVRKFYDAGYLDSKEIELVSGLLGKFDYFLYVEALNDNAHEYVGQKFARSFAMPFWNHPSIGFPVQVFVTKIADEKFHTFAHELN